MSIHEPGTGNTSAISCIPGGAQGAGKESVLEKKKGCQDSTIWWGVGGGNGAGLWGRRYGQSAGRVKHP